MGKYKKYFIPTIFVLPMILHWILPWGTELKFYASIGGITFFTPDILYVFYLVWYNTTSHSHRRIPMHRRAYLVLLSAVIVIYAWIVLVTKDVGYIPDLIINNLSFVWLSLIFLLAPLSRQQIMLTKPIMVAALVILVAEVLLFSLGILHYTSASGNTLRGHDFGGAMRISTTVAAATGTAVVIGLLGAIVCTIYDFTKRDRIAVMLLTSLGVYFTMSRGTSLLWTIYMIYFFYRQFFKHVSAVRKMRALLGAVAVVSIFYLAGGFNPIINRYEHMKNSRDASAGRDEKFSTSMSMINKSMPFGYGLGQVMPEKAIESNHDTPHHFAPHNVYTLIAIELGVVGLALFVLFLLLLMSGISYKAPLSVYIVLAMLINFNTESFVLDSECMALLLFAIMSVTKYVYSPKLYAIECRR